MSAEEENRNLRAVARNLGVWESDQLIRKAQLLEVPLELVDPDEYGWYVYRYDGFGGRSVHLAKMIFNWRISECDGPLTYARHWCFEGRGEDTFLRAALALKTWNCDPDSEPRGFIKSWDGRRDVV
jgi:hypothetical protein